MQLIVHQIILYVSLVMGAEKFAVWEQMTVRELKRPISAL